ncbi:hypothetical protein IV454_18925 [Massilia antarctica]|uniref:Uncharacterized protein n=1 Tax=Massilia antarctica TaxID=2765360 RepID=A0AA49A5U7_9BURK|nr:hypothetical protein [Massilia antarctica]QPI47659.1 hypothetical protein IV454_18925 [Massilia antarctica]
MNPRRGHRREPVEVAEARVPDRTIERLLGVRKQRLERLERERLQAREHWRQRRGAQRLAKLAWREARHSAAAHWQRARQQFFAMETDSRQFRAAQGGYERMKRATGQRLLAWRESAGASRAAGAAFFVAHRHLREVRRQLEKLDILRAHIKAMERRHDD